MRMTPAIVLAVAGMAMPAAAQTQWAAAVGGTWSNPVNWNPTDVPDSPGESALIAVAGSYDVMLDMSPTVDSVTIGIPDGTFYLTSGTVLTLVSPGFLTASSPVEVSTGTAEIVGRIHNRDEFFVPSGRHLRIAGPDFVNDGAVIINESNGAADASLIITADLLMNGSGNITMDGIGSNSQIVTEGGARLTTNNIISGRGQIRALMTSFGSVSSSLSPGLVLQTNDKINGGVYTASLADLTVSGITVNQSSGSMRATSGGDIVLTNAHVIGGGFTTFDSGVIRTTTSTCQFTGVTNNGTFHIATGSLAHVLGSGLTNEGTIVVNPTGGAADARLRFMENGLLDGAGTLHLFGNALDSQIETETGVTFVHGAAHLIHGRGTIEGEMVNNGTVEADFTGATLTLSSNAKTNNGVMRAVNDGTLHITGITISQGAGGLIEANDGEVVLSNSRIENGTVSTSGSGVVTVATATNTFDGVLNTGDVEVNTGQVLAIESGGLVNDGVITVNPTNGAANASFQGTETSTVSGSGSIVLAGVGPNAGVTTIAGQTLTQADGHTIRGLGDISGRLLNNGDVVADVTGGTMSLSGFDKTNNKTLMATNGGTLHVSNITIEHGPSGEIVGDGGDVNFASSTINDATLRTANGGLMTCTGAAVFHDVTSDSLVDVPTGSLLTVTGVGLVNDGLITVNPTNGGANSSLQFAVSGLLGGSGEVVLNGIAANSQLTTAVGQVLTIGANQTVSGRGNIPASLVNNGLIHSDIGGTLNLQSNDKINNAVIRSSGGSDVFLSPITLDQTGGGQVVIEDSTFTLGGGTVVGGQINATGTGLTSVTTQSFLDGVTLNSDVEVLTGRLLGLLSGVTNNGVIDVNPTNGGADATLQVVESLTIGGAGEIRLSGIGTNARLHTAVDQAGTVGAGQRLTGRGQVSGDWSLQGTVAPGLSVGALGATGDFAFETGSSYEVEIDDHESSDTISGSANIVINGGTLDVSYFGGFAPTDIVNVRVLSGLSVTGEFDGVNAPAPQPGHVWIVVYGDTFVDLRMIPDCDADFNQDGLINTSDFIAFLNAFVAEDPRTDFAFPFGTINTSDFIAFLNIYNTPCH